MEEDGRMWKQQREDLLFKTRTETGDDSPQEDVLPQLTGGRTGVLQMMFACPGH